MTKGTDGPLDGASGFALALFAVFGLGAAATAPTSAHAVSITMGDASPTYTDTRATCSRAGKNYKNCKSTASVDTTTSLDGADGEFKKSFDAWNAALAVGSKWTLKDGGALPGGDLEITIFDAIADPTLGGLEIEIEWDYGGTDKSSFYWSQGLLTNYKLDGSIVPEFYEMDVLSGKDQEPPLYPYQYADRSFYDKPMAPWPNSSFKARAFLSKADYTTRELTIYEGVQYQFSLSAALVPVPAGLVLGLSACTLLGVAGLRRRHVAKRA